MLPIFRVSVTPPDADLLRSQHPKLNLREALVASAEAKLSKRRSFWFFFLRLHSQEKERNELGHVTLRKFSPYFSLTPLAQRKVPKETPRKFRLCGGDQGLCPWSPPPFEKGGRKLSSCGGGPLGQKRTENASLPFLCHYTVWMPFALSAFASTPYFRFFLYSKNLSAICSNSA